MSIQRPQKRGCNRLLSGGIRLTKHDEKRHPYENPVTVKYNLQYIVVRVSGTV